MAKKSYSLQASIPAKLCFEMIHQIASQPKWKIRKADLTEKRLVFEPPSVDFMTSRIKVTVTLTELSGGTTQIDLVGEHAGLGDIRNLIPDGVERVLVPLRQMVSAAEALRNGLVCPTCSRELPAGTKFCPHDGTSITNNCPQCGQDNIPSARFCASCGKAI